MPQRGYMLKNDLCSIPPELMDGNGLIIYHPGRIDRRFEARVIAFMAEFEYEHRYSGYVMDEDFSMIRFEWEGELED